MSAVLERTAFTTSRLMDFFSEKELTAQIGHKLPDWPLVAVKELVDNALDSCEEADIAPEIHIDVSDDGITVTDNGPGIPSETVEGMLDYSIRVSSREAYLAPDRGAQGNALKTLVAMPFVLDGDTGRVDITANGIRHKITCQVDHIRQKPVIQHEQIPEIVKNGTFVKVWWPDSACSILRGAEERFLQIAQHFAFLNPHLTLSVNWFGTSYSWTATNKQWAKWKPNLPTSPHWYQPDHLGRLIAGYIAHDSETGRERTIREFISEFRGLTGSAKQKAVLDTTGFARLNLPELVNGSVLDIDKVTGLLSGMKEHSKPVKPQALGIIGKEHFAERFKPFGEMETFKYVNHLEMKDGLPWILEGAFVWSPEHSRSLITGVNWSPGILNPFREVGKHGESMDGILEQQRAGRDEPVVLVIHMACPRVSYSDRGKSAVLLEE